MTLRPHLVVVCLTALCMGAQYRTTNFVVDAPTPQIAQQLAQYAEHYRKEKALLWIGREMPAWGVPLPVQVTVTMNGAGGATSFAFDHGQILKQEMHIEGSLDRLLASVLPHEVTHTVFAYHFRCPVPRWADEGGAVLSEDEPERNRHDMLCRQLLNSPGQSIQLRTLFGLREYPQGKVMALYAEGYSVANFLVSQSSRGALINFVACGMTEGWDRACQQHYHYRNVEELEQAWLNSLRNPRPAATELVQNTPENGTPGHHVMTRLTAPPAQPILTGNTAVFRGATPGPEQDGQRFGDTPPANRPAPVWPTTPPIAVPESGWQPVPSGPPPQVLLGQPQFGPMPGRAQ
jgi:hypothetical protein